MRNDYLWDGSGEPDPEMQKLERALGRFRAEAKAPVFSASADGDDPAAAPGLRSVWRMPRWIAASALTAAIAAAAALVFVRVAPAPNRVGWNVAGLEGAPVVGESVVRGKGKQARLGVGELLVTDENSRASVQVAEVGELYVEPGSRVRLVETGRNRKRIQVELGTIHAAIWAPPGEFVVDTPSATAVDLGCAYTLTVADDGSGTLRATMGWVGFHSNGHDSFIPAGAMCLTRPKEGPGTPFFEDATGDFRAAVQQLDMEGFAGVERERALRTVLHEARTKDAFTLWHLLARTKANERAKVYARMAELVSEPAGTTREGTLGLEQKMMDAWWNAFRLGDIDVWRFWERNEAPPMKKAAN